MMQIIEQGEGRSFIHMVAELPFPPFSSCLGTEHWGCSYVLMLIQKTLKTSLFYNQKKVAIFSSVVISPNL